MVHLKVFLKVKVRNPRTCGRARKRYTVYETRLMTDIPHFKVKESTVSRRYRDFLKLKNEFKRTSTMEVPSLPG